MKLSVLFVIAFIIGTGLFLYSLIYEPYTLEITHYNLKNAKLSGLKIVLATDFHIAPYSFEKKRLHRIIDEINNQNADIVILGGDYVNGHTTSSAMPIADIVAELTKIKSRYGMFAILGNHDVMYGKQAVIRAFADADIPLLQNSNTYIDTPNGRIYLAGVNDYSEDVPDVEKALAGTTAPTILLSHSPDVFPKVKQPIDLMLSGHTHGGQIVFPLVGALLVPSDYGQRYRYGLIKENSNTLIVSKGLGTSLLPLRFNCKPEIVVIEFE
ncbi:MAG: metallophosphoesterase [Alphaproteobacteria bacterium]|nr:metallophosphoesterase [Alphaproteobacteria bacterium]